MIKIIKELLPKEQKFYFAVSMGIDSVAGYLYLRNKGYDLIPIHFNHKLRPQNDIMEEKFIELCKATNSNPIVGYGKNLNTESECRDARLNFYNENANGTIITAHHLNDWVESYLLNCFRGHPNKEPFNLISEFPNYKIIHPFLLSRKIDLQEFLDRNNYKHYTTEDETNSSVKGSRRNWIRKQIIPEMSRNKLSLEKFAKRRISKIMLEKVEAK